MDLFGGTNWAPFAVHNRIENRMASMSVRFAVDNGSRTRGEIFKSTMQQHRPQSDAFAFCIFPSFFYSLFAVQFNMNAYNWMRIPGDWGACECVIRIFIDLNAMPFCMNRIAHRRTILPHSLGARSHSHSCTLFRSNTAHNKIWKLNPQKEMLYRLTKGPCTQAHIVSEYALHTSNGNCAVSIAIAIARVYMCACVCVLVRESARELRAHNTR